MKKGKRLLALSLTLVMALSACTKPSEPKGGNDFVDWQLQANENTTFLLLYSEERANSKVLCNCYSPLIEYDKYGVYQPAMATEWSHNEDASEWTFKIRQGIQWVNQAGEPMAECTAWDWATGLEWILNYHKNQSKNTAMHFEVTKGAAEYYEYTKNLDAEAGKATTAKDAKFLEMVGIEIPDDYTVIYKLSKSVPYFESLCTGACIYPLSQAQVDAMGVDGVFGQQPNNMWYNGPYVISEYVQNNSKIFTPNPEYWDKDCQLFDSVEVKMVQDNLTDDEMFMNGEVDRCDLSESRLRLIYDNENDPNRGNLVQPRGVVGHSQILINYYKNNLDGTPDVNWNTAIANENFRQAIYWGWNTRDIWSYYNYIDPDSMRTENFTTEAIGKFSDGTDYVDRVEELIGVDRSVNRWESGKAEEYIKKAKEELSAQGVTFPVELAYYIKAGDQGAQDFATIFKNSIENIAEDFITVDIRTYITSLTKEVYSNKYQSCGLASWAADYGDPENFLNCLIAGDDAAYFGNRIMNVNSAEIPEIREVLDTFSDMTRAANTIGDLDERYEAQAQAEAYLYKHAVIIPMRLNATAWSLTKVNGFSTPFAAFGIQMDVYKNWETSTETYSAEDYARFEQEYNQGK